MKNVNIRLENGKLIIEVDLDKSFGKSKSGNSTTIATTGGNISVPGQPDIKLGLNVYRPD